jgi:hypothetical protein
MKIILITAIWCPSCLIMRPRYDHLKLTPPQIDIQELDYDIDQDEIRPFNPGKTLPIAIILEHGSEITRIIGEKSLREIQNIIGALKHE